jgi:hypothetical protein
MIEKEKNVVEDEHYNKNSMSIKDFEELTKIVIEEHSFAADRDTRKGKKLVKYMDPSFDVRIGRIFAINLRGYGWSKNFHVSHDTLSLKERVIEYINLPYFKKTFKKGYVRPEHYIKKES